MYFYRRKIPCNSLRTIKNIFLLKISIFLVAFYKSHFITTRKYANPFHLSHKQYYYQWDWYLKSEKTEVAWGHGKCSNDIYWNFSRHYMKNLVSQTKDKAHSVHLKKRCIWITLILCNTHYCSSWDWFCIYTSAKTYFEQNSKELPFHLAFSHLVQYNTLEISRQIPHNFIHSVKTLHPNCKKKDH